MIERLSKILSLALAVSALAACTDTQPYVWGTTVLKTVTVANKETFIPATVMVCYNAEWHDPKVVTYMARKECAKTGRKAKLLKQDVLACPVMLPARAHFECIGEPVIAKPTPRKSVVQPAQEPGPEIIEPVEPPQLPEHLRQ